MGTYLNKGIDFANGDQVTADKLDSLVESATFGSGAVDNSSTQLSGGAIIVKDGGITTSKIASGVTVSFADGSAAAPSITNAGDSNTGIFFPSEDQVSVACGGTYAANFQFNEQGGQLSLNDTSGGGNLLIDNYNGASRFIKSGSGNVIYGTDGTGTVSIMQNNATQLTINASGNVGIGTTSPATKLDVSGGITVSDGVRGGLKYETSIATTSGTNIDFTSIPSWVKRISVVLSNVSTNGTSELLMQLGDSGGFETTGYIGSVAFDAGRQSLTNGIGLGTTNSAAYQNTGIITLVKVTSSGNKWVASGTITQSGSTYVYVTSSSKETSDTLTSLRITTAGGVNTFDAGEINLIYEG